MITFFSSAKPFRGQAAVQQRNGIGSWLRLYPDAEIMLFGRDEGVAEICAELALIHVPDVECTEFGTPLLSHMYAHAQAAGRHPILCSVNADIILLEDFRTGVERVARTGAPFVMTGRRTNLDFDEPLDFTGDWRRTVSDAAAARGTPGHPLCLDYFVFRRGSIPSMPAFAIGRPAWDNWLLMDVRRRRVDLIDASAAIAPIHQNHGYGHVPKATGQGWEGPEADRNRNLAAADAPGFQPRLHTIFSGNKLLTARGIQPALTRRHLGWKLYAWAEYRNVNQRALEYYYRSKGALFRLRRNPLAAVERMAPSLVQRLARTRIGGALRLFRQVHQMGGRTGVRNFYRLLRGRTNLGLIPVGDALQRHGKIDAARVIWTRWLALEPTNQAIRERLLRLHIEQGELAAAAALAPQASYPEAEPLRAHS